MMKFLLPFLLFATISASSDTCPYPCNGHPLTAYYAKNPRGCAWFFTCNIGRPPKEGRCPDGYILNHEKQICDYPENVQCNDNVATKVCPNFGITKIPHPDTCSNYILCFDGKEQDRKCPLGMHFSTFDNDCVHPDQSECVTDNEFCDIKRDENPNIFPRVANPRNCGTFYVCSQDNWVISNDCFNGWHFNPSTGFCEDARDAGCDPANEQEQLDLPDIVEFDCAGQFDGSAHAHPEACDFWYICVGGRSLLQRCGTDTVFDDVERRCIPGTC